MNSKTKHEIKVIVKLMSRITAHVAAKEVFRASPYKKQLRIFKDRKEYLLCLSEMLHRLNSLIKNLERYDRDAFEYLRIFFPLVRVLATRHESDFDTLYKSFNLHAKKLEDEMF